MPGVRMEGPNVHQNMAIVFTELAVAACDQPSGPAEPAETRSIAPSVLPTRYAVSDDRTEFEGTSPKPGAVRFEGRIDPGVLATSRRNLGDEGVVVTGTLRAAGQTVSDVRLRWWTGD